jgi:hypothetical protein
LEQLHLQFQDVLVCPLITLLLLAEALVVAIRVMLAEVVEVDSVQLLQQLVVVVHLKPL